MKVKGSDFMSVNIADRVKISQGLKRALAHKLDQFLASYEMLPVVKKYFTIPDLLFREGSQEKSKWCIGK
jgi:hypothetical protein